jgi:1,4-alpha-glucan branching enzyme
MPASNRFSHQFGALVYDGGVTFRVWAPFATGVAVVGNLTGGAEVSIALEPEAGGCWSVDAPEAKPRQKYQFDVKGVGRRTDPYARAVINSADAGEIYDPHFAWQNQRFQMPPWNELVIHELPHRHIPG